MPPRVPFAERGGRVRGVVDLATGCYPAFLFGGSTAGLVPVFHLHEVTRESLEPRLRHIAENGYRTLTCGELSEIVQGRASADGRSVALTFDDAWTSVWTVAFPLLKQYGLTATVFAIGARIPDAGNVRTSDDGQPFATWPELQALQSSGIVDVQSHTRAHAMIFASDERVGYVTPGYAREPLLERPLIRDGGRPGFLEPSELGAPVYQRRSRMSDARRFVPDADAFTQPVAHVRVNGGAAFFGRPHWDMELARLTPERAGRWEPDDERRRAIRRELADGREMLNGGLRTTTVRHVALPWGIAGETARRALADTGHELAFAERPFRKRAVRPGDDPHALMRLNGRFITCLPGTRRTWFFGTFRHSTGGSAADR